MHAKFSASLFQHTAYRAAGFGTHLSLVPTRPGWQHTQGRNVSAQRAKPKAAAKTH